MLANQVRVVASHAGEPEIECNCGTRYRMADESATFRAFTDHLVAQHEDGDALLQALPAELRPLSAHYNV